MHTHMYTHTHILQIPICLISFWFLCLIFLFSLFKKGGGVQNEALNLEKDLRKRLRGLPLIQDCIKWKEDPLAYLSNIGLF